MTAVGFEPTQLSLVEVESAPLDHSGTLPLTTPNVHFYFLIARYKDLSAGIWAEVVSTSNMSVNDVRAPMSHGSDGHVSMRFQRGSVVHAIQA